MFELGHNQARTSEKCTRKWAAQSARSGASSLSGGPACAAAWLLTPRAEVGHLWRFPSSVRFAAPLRLTNPHRRISRFWLPSANRALRSFISGLVFCPRMRDMSALRASVERTSLRVARESLDILPVFGRPKDRQFDHSGTGNIYESVAEARRVRQLEHRRFDQGPTGQWSSPRHQVPPRNLHRLPGRMSPCTSPSSSRS